MAANDGNDIESVTRRVIDTMTYDGFLFTALDVSNEVKKVLPGVRHREVAPIVRDIYSNGDLGEDYTRTLIDVIADGHKKVQTFLYHLDDDDPEDYTGSQRRQMATPPVSIQDQRSALSAKTECLVDIGKDGRARIARAFLEQAGINGPDVQVELDGAGPALALCNPTSTGNTVCATIQFNHPVVFHLPLTLLSAFDLSKPLHAKIAGQRILIAP